MRLRLMLAIAAVVAVLALSTGSAYASCVTPCPAHQNCIQMCSPIGDIIAPR
jgi:hypothetical protein